MKAVEVLKEEDELTNIISYYNIIRELASLNNCDLNDKTEKELQVRYIDSSIYRVHSILYSLMRLTSMNSNFFFNKLK